MKVPPLPNKPPEVPAVLPPSVGSFTTLWKTKATGEIKASTHDFSRDPFIPGATVKGSFRDAMDAVRKAQFTEGTASGIFAAADGAYEVQPLVQYVKDDAGELRAYEVKVKRDDIIDSPFKSVGTGAARIAPNLLAVVGEHRWIDLRKVNTAADQRRHFFSGR